MEEIETRVASEEVQNIYFSFYRDLICEVFDFNEEIFADEVYRVRRACHVDDLEISNGESRPWLKFDKEAVRCAYLLRYSVLNTISLSEHFLEAITFGSDMLDKFSTKPTLRIVCLGGGAGAELVGIVKTINDYLNHSEEELKTDPLQLCFTVFDQYDEWRSWITSLVKHLKCNNAICCKRNVDVRLRFYSVDLIAEWDERTVRAVKKADVLTMVRFVSAYCESMSDETYDQKEDLKLLSKIAQTMKLGARIFFLDYAGGGHYHKVEKCYDKYQFMEKIKSNLHQTHHVDIRSEELVTRTSILKEMLGVHNTKISSCLWSKCIPEARKKRCLRKKR